MNRYAHEPRRPRAVAVARTRVLEDKDVQLLLLTLFLVNLALWGYTFYGFLNFWSS